MTRKRFFALLASVPLCGAIAARLRASEPVVHAVIPPKEQPCVPVDFDVLLWAIAQVESGGDDKKVGRCGSRSKYQISEKVWRQHMNRTPNTTFAKGCHGQNARVIAYLHLSWLDRHIPRVTLAERYEREWCLAYAWNAGLVRYASLRDTAGIPQAHFYATRVQNTYLSRLSPTPT